MEFLIWSTKLDTWPWVINSLNLEFFICKNRCKISTGWMTGWDDVCRISHRVSGTQNRYLAAQLAAVVVKAVWYWPGFSRETQPIVCRVGERILQNCSQLWKAAIPNLQGGSAAWRPRDKPMFHSTLKAICCVIYYCSGRSVFFVLFRLSSGWMRPTHNYERQSALL